MKRILITGASGGVGSWLRKLLRPHYELVLSDLRPPAALEPHDSFIAAEKSAREVETMGIREQNKIGCGRGERS